MNNNSCSWLTLVLRAEIDRRCVRKIFVCSCFRINGEFTIRVNLIPEGEFTTCVNALKRALCTEKVRLEIQ